MGLQAVTAPQVGLSPSAQPLTQMQTPSSYVVTKTLHCYSLIRSREDHAGK